MNEKLAIKMVELQLETEKRWQHFLQGVQTDDDFKQSNARINAMDTVLELAKRNVEELEE